VASTSSGAVTTYTCNITAVDYGTYTVTARYPGDVNYTGVTSNTVSLQVSTLTPTLTLSTASTPTLGGSITLKVVAVGHTGTPAPAGTMGWTVRDPAGVVVTCGSPSITAGAATPPTTNYFCTFPTVIAGTYSATANFPGDSNYSAGNSTTLLVVVPKATPTLSVTGIQSTTANGQITTFTGTIVGSTGSVAPTNAPTWTLTGASGCDSTTGPVTSGVSTIYTCTIASNSSGSYSAAITYPGDSNYNGVGPSATYSINVVKATPTVFVTTSTATTQLGNQITFSATVTGPTGGQTPTGTPTWSITGVSGVSCASYTGPVGSSTSVVYTCTVNTTVAGSYVPLFTYNGDSNYLATSPTSGASTSVTKGDPAVAVVANAATAALGTTVTFTATVTGPSGAVAPSAAGQWAITGVGGVTTCTSTTGPSQSSNVSTYTCSVTASVAGTYGANFIFTGDTSYNPVISNASSSTTVVAPALPTVVLSALPSQPRLGGTLTVTAVITGATGAVPPAGNISWTLNGTAGVGACASNGGPTVSGNSTTYTCAFQTPNVGTYIIQASVAADANYLTASSSALTLTIVKQLPGITVSASAHPQLGGTTTVTTVVSGLASAVVPTGSVSTLVTDPTGAVIACSGQSAASISGSTATYTCTFATNTPGSYHVNSTVAEDANYLTATSTTISVNLGAATPSLTIFPPSGTQYSGATLTFAAVVGGVTNLPAPTGTLVWTVSGKASTCTSNPSSTSSGTTTIYTCIIAAPVAGAYNVSAAYNGDINFSAVSTATPTTITVQPATPTLAIAITPVTPSIGNVLTYTATVTGVSGAVRPGGTITWTVTGGQATTCATSTGPTPGTTAIQAVFTCTINASTAGTYSVSATYSGDSNFTALAPIAATDVIIPKVTPTLALTGLGDGITGGTATFTLTETVPAGAATPSDNVNWSITGSGGANACANVSAPSTSGRVTTYICHVTEITYGTFVVTATFTGDSNYYASVSNTVTVSVQNLVPSVNVTVSASPAPVLGGSTTLTALVVGQAGSSVAAVVNPTTYSCPTGKTLTVDGSHCQAADTFVPATPSYFCNNADALSGTTCTAPDNSTYAATPGAPYSCATGTLTGSNTCDIPGAITAGTANPTSYSCPTGTAGRVVGTNCLVDVLPTGSVTWTVTSPGLTSVACTNSAAAIDTSQDLLPTTAFSCLLPTATAGNYSAYASYSGDLNYDTKTSSTITIPVAQVAPTISIVGAPLTNIFGAPVTFTATVAGVANSLAPTDAGGGITWYLGGPSSSCQSQTGPIYSGVNAVYTCVVPVIAAGTYTANIGYAGDSNYLAVPHSATTSITVGPELPTITFTTTPASPNLGDTLTITATINAVPGGPTPGGTVVWTLSGTAGATTCDSTTGVGTYVQSCIVVARTAGTYIAQAAYSGDNNYLHLTVSANPITIQKALPTVTISNSGNPAAGGSVIFTAIVAGVDTAATPTGTFTWTISGTGNTTPCSFAPASISVAHAIVYSCKEDLPTIGTYVATGSYSGDANYLPNNAAAADVVTIISNAPQYLPITLGQITNLKAVPTDNGAVVPVSVTWDPLLHADTYIVQVGPDSSTLQTFACTSNTLNSCRVTGLIAGNTYTIWVNGYGLGGQGIPASVVITIPPYAPPVNYPPPTPPAPVGGLPATTVPLPLAAPSLTGVGGDKQVTLSWSPVKDDNRKGYNLDYSVDGQTFSKAISLAANAGSAVVTGLTNGVSTIFRLTPTGEAGSGVAAIVSVTPGVVAQAPTGLTAASGDSQVSLSWNAPTDTGGLPINNYVIEQSTDGTTWSLASSTPGNTTQVNLQGLKNFTNYTFRVSAITNFGKGLSATLSANASALPSAPLSLHIVSSASKTVTVGWELPAGAPAGSITGFQVEQSLDGSNWTTAETASGTSLSSTIGNLTNGSTYEIRVTPISGAGLGASSVILASPGAAPDPVTGLTAVAGDKKITLNFKTPLNNGGYSVDYYTVQIANSANGPWTVAIPNTGSSLTTVNVPSLKNGTTYFFKVNAINQIGTSADSAVASATPQPAAPAPVITSFIMTNTTARIGWTPAVGSNIKLVLNFLVETSPDGLKWTTAATLLPSVRNYVVNRNKTPLLIRVRAVSVIGPGVPTLGVRIPGTVATVTPTTPGGTTSGTKSTTPTPKTSTTPTPKTSTTPTPKTSTSTTKSTTSGALKTGTNP